MMAKFLKDDDLRLNQIGRFEVRIVSIEIGDTIDSIKYHSTSFNEISADIKRKYEEKIEISVLDYGDELRAILTPNKTENDYYYVVLKL